MRSRPRRLPRGLLIAIFLSELGNHIHVCQLNKQIRNWHRRTVPFPRNAMNLAFVSDLRQVDGFPRVLLLFAPPINWLHNITEKKLLKVALNTIKQNNYMNMYCLICTFVAQLLHFMHVNTRYNCPNLKQADKSGVVKLFFFFNYKITVFQRNYNVHVYNVFMLIDWNNFWFQPFDRVESVLISHHFLYFVQNCDFDR
jgi:hypothetical protein